MPINKKFLARFEFGKVYHVYNRSNDGELLFRSDGNKAYFLKQFEKYLSPVLDIYAWNLLDNHFHLVIKVKQCNDILENLKNRPAKKAEKEFLNNQDISKLLHMYFKRFFTSYAMAFNKVCKRKGNLFHRQFKRIEITDEQQLLQTLVYVHANAQKHRLAANFNDHKWTSYHQIINKKLTIIRREEILEWFGGIEAFIKIHSLASGHYYEQGLPVVMDG